jgi:multiple antibiotic resistance protein
MVEPAQIFTMFFVTLGPEKVLAPFALRTRDMELIRARQIAFRAFAIATLGIVLGGFVGAHLLAEWHVSLAALMLAGGVVFFLVALKHLLAQSDAEPASTPVPLPAAPLAAAAKLVPVLLTPYGVAAVVALLAASTGPERTATILGLLLAVMGLNLIAMWFARQILIGPVVVVLQVLGSVLAVMQLALSVQFILAGLRALGSPSL